MAPNSLALEYKAYGVALRRSPLNYHIAIPGVTCVDRSSATFARILAIITVAQEWYVAKQSGCCSPCILHKAPAAFPRQVCQLSCSLRC